MEYIAPLGHARPKFCIFCELPKDPARRRENLVLAVRPHSFAMLNRFPFSAGHLMVAPARHVASPELLDPAEYAALMEHLKDALVSLRGAVRPEGVNVGMNLGAPAGAGIADHIHWHLVPRWTADTNFLPVIAGVRVMPEYLQETYDRLAPHFGP